MFFVRSATSISRPISLIIFEERLRLSILNKQGLAADITEDAYDVFEMMFLTACMP